MLLPLQEALLRSLGDMVTVELEMRRRTSFTTALQSLAVPRQLRTRKALQLLSHELRTPLHCILGSLELVMGPCKALLPCDLNDCLQDAWASASTMMTTVVEQLSMSDGGAASDSNVVSSAAQAHATATASAAATSSCSRGPCDHEVEKDDRCSRRPSLRDVPAATTHSHGSEAHGIATSDSSSSAPVGHATPEARHASCTDICLETASGNCLVSKSSRSESRALDTASDSAAASHMASLPDQLPRAECVSNEASRRCHPLIVVGRRISVADPFPTTGSELNSVVSPVTRAPAAGTQQPFNPSRDTDTITTTPATPTPSAARGIRVLIVDDEPLNLRLLERQLRRLDVTASIVAATNGLEAVNAEARHAFDVVICDLQMPVMGGTEACAHIVARHRGRDSTQAAVSSPTPTVAPAVLMQATGIKGRLPLLVALTADSTAGVQERCSMSGFHMTLTKPADISTLQRVLDATIARRDGCDDGLRDGQSQSCAPV